MWRKENWGNVNFFDIAQHIAIKIKKYIDPFLGKMHRNLLVPILQIPFFASYVLFIRVVNVVAHHEKPLTQRRYT